MAYNAVPTVATGDTWSAANHNTYIRDNFAAGIPDIFTSAGDIAYAIAANSATILPIGSSDSILTVSGGVPSWGSGPGMVLLDSQIISSSDVAEIVFNPISQAFTHLKIEINYITSSTDTAALYGELNADSSTNVYTEFQINIKSDNTLQYLSYTTSPYFATNAIFANPSPNHSTIDIYNYSDNSLYKNGKIETYFYSSETNITFKKVYLRYLNTNPITQIRLYINQVDYPGRYIADNSSFQLYGIK